MQNFALSGFSVEQLWQRNVAPPRSRRLTDLYHNVAADQQDTEGASHESDCYLKQSGLMLQTCNFHPNRHFGVGTNSDARYTKRLKLSFWNPGFY
jgi:hypothetical protein